MARSQKVVPCLWFDTQAEEAASFYASLFEGSRIGTVTRYGKEGFEIHGRPEGTAMTVDFELAGYRFVGLNGGPLFTFTPAISFFVVRETEAEVDELWRALSEGGSVLMELAEYPWSEKYGWLADRFGLSWQIALGRVAEAVQAITPALLFVGEQCGRAEEAMNLYTSLFEESGITHIQRSGPEGAPGDEGLVQHAAFTLDGGRFTALDSAMGHAFSFNEAVSFMVSCGSQEEVDHFWQGLSDGGEEGACGWLKDRFGVSWQVVPTILPEILLNSDSGKVARVTRALLQMGKLDIAALEKAAQGG